MVAFYCLESRLEKILFQETDTAKSGMQVREWRAVENRTCSLSGRMTRPSSREAMTERCTVTDLRWVRVLMPSELLDDVSQSQEPK